MELAEVSDGKIGNRITSPLGPLTLQNIKGGKKAIKTHIATVIAGLVQQIGVSNKRIYLVGGSWRAIARLDMERRGYPLHVLHEYRMTPNAISATAKWIAKNDINALRQKTGTSEARMSLVPIASEVLRQLVRAFKPREIAVSSYGIREGMLYEQMPDRLRRRDPLIEACKYAEAKDARNPGAGKSLNAFIAPLFRAANPARRRMIKAACLLHDVTWRAHPDFRSEVCFDNATRANLGGLTHSERIWLGLALLHRYKNSSEGSRVAPLFDLLSEKERQSAEVVGKAMRFGAMFSIDAPDKVARLKWQPKKALLTIALTPEGIDLFGEVARARFLSLAQSLGAEVAVKNLRA
jgi:exopolyphosphatase/guanosine-5'-triphosphate,3'-diphosphate pyrophosphatase